MLLNVKRYGAQTTLGLYKKHYKNTKDFPNVWKLYSSSMGCCAQTGGNQGVHASYDMCG